eukprot:6167375-Prymnesium_polylepis.2
MGPADVCACMCVMRVRWVCECSDPVSPRRRDGRRGGRMRRHEIGQGSAALPVQLRHRHARGAAAPPFSRHGPCRAP